MSQVLAIIDLTVRDMPASIVDEPGYAWQVLDGDDEVFAGTCEVASEDEDEWTRQADALLLSEGFRRIGPWRDGERDDTTVAEVEQITPAERLRAYREARADLPDAIRAAFAAGMSQTEVQSEAGLSRAGLAKFLGRTTHAVITDIDRERAIYLAQTTGGEVVPGRGRATITEAGLRVLAGLDEHADGHFDGTHVWIGGTEFLVQHTGGEG